MTTISPEISVLMPTYNAGTVIRSAIVSILKQQGPTFELIIIDDGSYDNTCDIIRSYTDSRIKLISNGSNLGVAASLNRGLELAKGKYILRMDSDDICYQSRFKKQYQFMEKNPDIGISGTWIKLFGDEYQFVNRSPVGKGVIKAYVLFNTPFFHPTVIIRKELLDRYRLKYDSTYCRSEDYDLWLRASDFFSLDNIPEPLLRFRCHKSSVTNTESGKMYEQTCHLQRRALLRIGIEPSSDELKFHYHIGKCKRIYSEAQLSKAECWLLQLSDKNKETGYCLEEDFLKAVGFVWFNLCLNSAQLGLLTLKKFYASPLSAFNEITLIEKARFLMSILYHCCKRKVWFKLKDEDN